MSTREIVFSYSSGRNSGSGSASVTNYDPATTYQRVAEFIASKVGTGNFTITYFYVLPEATSEKAP